MPIEVIKIGGRLLAEPDALNEVASWLQRSEQQPRTRVLIVGGGAVVEGLRRIDAANPSPERLSHWAAIELMDANARLVADRLGPSTQTESLDRVRRGHAAGRHADWLLTVGPFLRREEPGLPGERLRVGRRTTSDSIAARVAGVLGAELTLLKHSIPPEVDGRSLDELARRGVVDPEFPRLAAPLEAFRVLGIADLQQNASGD